MAEFGGSLVDESIKAERSREGVEPDRSVGMTEDGIELEEFQSWPQGAEITEAAIGESSSYLIKTTWSNGIFKGSDLEHSHHDSRRLGRILLFSSSLEDHVDVC